MQQIQKIIKSGAKNHPQTYKKSIRTKRSENCGPDNSNPGQTDLKTQDYLRRQTCPLMPLGAFGPGADSPGLPGGQGPVPSMQVPALGCSRNSCFVDIAFLAWNFPDSGSFVASILGLFFMFLASHFRKHLLFVPFLILSLILGPSILEMLGFTKVNICWMSFFLKQIFFVL